MGPYQIYERGTNKPVGKPYQNRQRARTRVDKLDNAYGSYHYYMKDLSDGRTTL